MTEEALLQLTQQFFSTPEGEQLLKEVGIEVDVESIQRKISLLDKDLSRDERQKERKDKRENNQKKRKQNRIDKRKKRKEEIIQLRAQLKGNIPIIKTFQIKGKLFDKNTGNPLEGVKIKALKAIVNKFKTNNLGEFDIKIKLAVLPAEVTIKVDSGEETRNINIRPNDVILLQPKLLYTQSGYVPTIQEIINLDNTVKSDLNTLGLINIKEEANKVKREIKEEIDEGKKKINQLALSLPEAAVVARRKQIMKITNIITGRLIPLLIGLLISFGITKLIQKDQKICPTPETLRDNIKRRNRVVRQLNQIYTAIIVNTALAAIFFVIAKALKSAKTIVDGLPIPLVSQPYTTVSKLDNISDFLQELEEQNKDLNKQTLIALVFLVAAVISVVVLLKGLDELTEECAGEEDLEFEPINQELQDLTEEQAEEGFPLVTEVNGFIMGIELEKNTVGSLKRRFATAKNKQGIIQLKGEPSFSATDQILIDELAFYITSNNLKAF